MKIKMVCSWPDTLPEPRCDASVEWKNGRVCGVECVGWSARRRAASVSRRARVLWSCRLAAGSSRSRLRTCSSSRRDSRPRTGRPRLAVARPECASAPSPDGRTCTHTVTTQHMLSQALCHMLSTGDSLFSHMCHGIGGSSNM